MSLETSSDGLSEDTFVLDDKLARIRTQINSKLDNQKHLALILSAVEENIEEQKNEKTPVAYFVSFLSLLNQSVKDDVIVDSGLATTTAYFLDLVLPFTPKPLLKAKFSEILTKLAPALTNPESEAPLIRSTIGALESLLLAQDNQQWNSNGNISPKRAFVGLLELSFDPRPKVRRRAQDSVNKILSNPPPSPSPAHSVSSLAGDISLTKLTSLIEESRKNKTSNKELNSQIIHCLQLIGSITSSNSWPVNKIEPLCDILLEISKTSDQYLVSAAFSAFEGLFKSMADVINLEKFSNVLNIIFDLKPSKNDTHLAASWLAVVAKALECFGKSSPQDAIRRIPQYFPIISEFLSSESQDIYSSASQCLIAIITEVIPDNYLLNPGTVEEVTEEIYELMDDTITYLAEYIEKELLSIKFQYATKDILEFISATILKLRTRCNPDFLGIVGVVGEWRTNETDQFPYNTEADNVIAASISTMGPDVVLGVLPLNLSNGNSQGRAWLLPLLRDNVRFTDLNYYKKSILPIIEFFESKISASSNKESVNVKIFQTIVDQIWSLLPHFCDLPKDLIVAFDDSFAAHLSDLMYSRVELRVPICHALRLLVESNLAYREGALEDDLLTIQEFPISQAVKNLEYLSTKASNILSVLFNVYSSTLPESRGFVLETIDSYLQVMSNEDLEITFNKVCGLFKTSLDQEASQEKSKHDNSPKLSVTMMDLIVAMAKYVPETSYNALFTIFSGTVTSGQDALTQKRAYRIISKLCETEKGKVAIRGFINEIERVFIETTEGTHSSARASRLNAISEILDLLPETDLYFIPATLQEIIISTKDVNERTRELSYTILIKMGNAMLKGGVVENSKVPGFPEDSPNTEANITEYLTMVSAGLAAQAPHMISATITAISCLMFEFKDKLPTEVLLEICSTVELFLTHNSREIAKSAIGFVKVEVLSLPEELIKNNLKELLEKLMKWSHEHKGHFKSKVKHILERLIRKFGIEEVENAIPEQDRKLVANIKKSRNRAKRKQQEETEEDGKSTSGEKKFVSAYEEALYDSDSDDDNDNEEVDQRKSNKKAPAQFILEKGEDPLNLLDRQTLAHISSSKPSKFSKKDVKESQFKTKNGKLVFNDNDNDEDPLANKGSGLDAYLEAVKQAPIRGQRNKLKYKRGNRNAEDDWSDDEQDTPETSNRTKNPNKGKNLTNSRVNKPKQKFKARKKL
ncbi:NUC173 domain-containing protein [Scheffersomyces amazonensis]|uniref:NUC173 domain-containing protein n=1 Tax=Scheffersomyces amazonensis TaxID=1078765 RepID=UPI00315D8148